MNLTSGGDSYSNARDRMVASQNKPEVQGITEVGAIALKLAGCLEFRAKNSAAFTNGKILNSRQSEVAKRWEIEENFSAN